MNALNVIVTWSKAKGIWLGNISLLVYKVVKSQSKDDYCKADTV